MMLRPWPRLPASESPTTTTFRAPGGTSGGAGTVAFSGLCVNSEGTTAVVRFRFGATGSGAAGCRPVRDGRGCTRGASTVRGWGELGDGPTDATGAAPPASGDPIRA